MANMQTRVVGFPQLQIMLNRIPYEVDNKKLWLAIFRATGQPFAKAAKQNVSKYKEYSNTNALKKSIKVFTTRASRKRGFVYVGPHLTNAQKGKKGKSREGGYYGAMLELGHKIERGSNKAAIKEHPLAASQKVVQRVLNRIAKGGKKLYK